MPTHDDVLLLEKKLLEREDRLEKERASLELEKESVRELKTTLIEKLEKVSHMNADEAKKKLLEAVEEKEVQAVAKIIKEKEEEARLTADKKAKEVLVEAMRHGAVSHVAEYTVSIVKIDDEDVKGRIIGKEGRNIRTFEQATGVDVDLDEEGVIRLSSFDQVRREVARRALVKLLRDTRIQPFRIEEVVKQTTEEVNKIFLEEGERISQEAGVYNLPLEMIAMLGRFKFRTSYGQSLVLHSLEVTKIGVHIAQEIGANVDIVRLGGLFHDIGKVIEGDGSHVKLGVDFLRRFSIPEAVIDCVAQHHEDVPFSSIESVIVATADALSAARPGARYEDFEGYVNRLREMEKIAKKFEGVEDAYAFEAGRELRVIIDPGKLDDAGTIVVANKIREEASRSQAVPGEIKVTAIREFRAVSSEFSR